MPELSQPLLGFVDSAYFRGSTASTKSTSASGAKKALEHRAQKIDKLRRVWVSPLTIQDVAFITHFPIASVCSLKKCLESELEEVDQVEKFWPDGSVTKRTRWKLRQA